MGEMKRMLYKLGDLIVDRSIEHSLFVNGKRQDTGETKEDYIKVLCTKAWEVLYAFNMQRYTSVYHVQTVAEKKGIEGLKEYLGYLAGEKYIVLNRDTIELPRDERIVEDIRRRFSKNCFDDNFTFSFDRIKPKNKNAMKHYYPIGFFGKIRAWLKGDKGYRK